MKRLLLLCSALILNCAVFAQDFNIYVTGGNQVMNDSTITINGVVSTNHISYLVVKNINAGSLNVKVKYTVIGSVAGAQNSMCWGIFCGGPSSSPTGVSSSTQAIGSNANDSTFSGHYYDNGTPGIETVRYVFYNVGNANDSSWIIVKYNITPLGIEQLNANILHISAPYPNPANNVAGFNYRLNGAQQASLKLYNTLGQCVETLSLGAESDKVNVNVSGLPSGIYICKLEASNGQPVFQKLIVTH